MLFFMISQTHSVIFDRFQIDFGVETCHDWNGQARLESKEQTRRHPIHVEEW